jgi:bacteriophage CI repressor helix-turn-helix domain
METDINRLKVVLAEKKRTNKWLCEQLNVNPSTVSKWCTNSSQPDLETLVKISNLLDVELGDLVNKKIITSQPID